MIYTEDETLDKTVFTGVDAHDNHVAMHLRICSGRRSVQTEERREKTSWHVFVG